MAFISYPYTQQELYDNYEFKVVKKALMREYPWIKNVTVDPNILSKYNLIFLDLDIDPVKLGEEQGWNLTPWVKTAYEKGKEYKGMYLSLFFDKVNYEDTKELNDGLIELIRGVHYSPALPSDLKIRGDRTFSIGDFYLNQGSEPWF